MHTVPQKQWLWAGGLLTTSTGHESLLTVTLAGSCLLPPPGETGVEFTDRTHPTTATIVHVCVCVQTAVTVAVTDGQAKVGEEIQVPRVGRSRLFKFFLYCNW